MTVLLDQAIRDLAVNYGIIYQVEEEPVLETIDQETWEEIAEYRKFLDELEVQRCTDELEKIKKSSVPQINKSPIENDNRR